MFGRMGMGELLLILGIVLLIFGPTKLPALAKSMGQAVREFRKGTKEITDELDALSKDEEAEKKGENTVKAETAKKSESAAEAAEKE